MIPRSPLLVRRAAQRGLSLIFALLALAAMSLAAIALVRSVDTGSQVLGNLGFKQDATSASDRGTEAAIAWLLANGSALDADHPDRGYYATSLDRVDPTGRVTSASNKLAVINWGDADSCACVAAGTCESCTLLPSGELPAVNGTRSRYFIARVCQKAEPVGATNVCAKPATQSISNAAARGEINAGGYLRPNSVVTSPYYRIVVRTVGARNAVSFTESIVHF